MLELVRSLRQLCFSIEREVRREAGLTQAQVLSLLNLNPTEVITCQEFSQRMDLSFSRGSRVIDALVRKGLISRTSSKADRRCKRIKLTKKGLEVQKKVHQILQRQEARWRKKLGKEKTDKLTEFILQILENE
jgi:MarR family multiple gene transcriptional regulator MgrA